jgi:hypothetical protein
MRSKLLLIFFVFLKYSLASRWLCDRSQNHGTFTIPTDENICKFNAIATDEAKYDVYHRRFDKPLPIHDIGHGRVAPTDDTFQNIGSLSLIGPSSNNRGIISLNTSSFDTIFPSRTSNSRLFEGITLFGLHENDDKLELTNLIVRAYTRDQIWSEVKPYLRVIDVRGAGTVIMNNVTFSGWTNSVMSIARGSTTYIVGCSFHWNKRYGIDAKMGTRGSVIYGGNDQFQESDSLLITKITIIRSSFLENLMTSIQLNGIKGRLFVDSTSFIGSISRPTNALNNQHSPLSAITINDPDSSPWPTMTTTDYMNINNSTFSYYYGTNVGVISSRRGVRINMIINKCTFTRNSQRGSSIDDAAVLLIGFESKNMGDISGNFSLSNSYFYENVGNFLSSSCISIKSNGLQNIYFTLINTIFEKNGQGYDPLEPSKLLASELGSTILIDSNQDSTFNKLNVNINNCQFLDNHGLNSKANAVVVNGPSTINIASSLFTRNTGGAILCGKSESNKIILKIVGSQFINNIVNTETYKGGGISFSRYHPKLIQMGNVHYTLILIGNTFNKNEASFGGALFLTYSEKTNLLLEGNSFSNNILINKNTGMRGRDIYLLYSFTNSLNFNDDSFEKCTPSLTTCNNHSDCKSSGRCQGICSPDSDDAMVGKRCQGSELSSKNICDSFRLYLSPGLSAYKDPRNGQCINKFCCNEKRNNIIMRDTFIKDPSQGRCDGNNNDINDHCWTSSIFGQITSKHANNAGLQSNMDVSLPRTCSEEHACSLHATKCEDKIDQGVKCVGCEWIASIKCYICNPDLTLMFSLKPDLITTTSAATFEFYLKSPNRWNDANCNRMKYQYKVDNDIWIDRHDDGGGNNGNDNMTLSFKELNEGLHTISIRAMDPNIQKSSWDVPILNHTWKIDRTYPVASITTVSGSLFESTYPFTNQPNINVELGSNEPGSGVSWTVKSNSGREWSCPILQAQGCSTIPVKIDDTKILEKNINKPNSASIDGLDYYGITSGEASRITECICMIGAASATTKETLVISNEGKHTLEVTAKDYSTNGNGNIQPQPTTFIWYYDATPPITILKEVVLDTQSLQSLCSSSKSNNNDDGNNIETTRSGNIRVTFGANQVCEQLNTNECSPLSNYIWKHTLDASTIVSMQISVSGIIELKDLIHGKHTISAKVTDGAGNVGNSVIYTWLVDQEAPIAKFHIHGLPRQVVASSTTTTTTTELKIKFSMECWDGSQLVKESGCSYQYSLLQDIKVIDKENGPTTKQLDDSWFEQVRTLNNDLHEVNTIVPQPGVWWVSIRGIDKADNIQVNNIYKMKVDIIRYSPKNANALRMKDIKVSLPPPATSDTDNNTSGHLLYVRWTSPDKLEHSIQIEWSFRRQFDIDITSKIIENTKETSTTIHTSQPISHEVVYVRIKIISENVYSDPSIDTWITIDRCKESNEYLNNIHEHLVEWKCIACPIGAYCNKESTTMNGLLPLEGYWSVPWTIDETNSVGMFEKCPGGKGNCLGISLNKIDDDNDNNNHLVTSGDSNYSNYNKTTCGVGVQSNSIVCAVCSNGYTKTGGPNGNCTSCNASSLLSQMIGIILMIVLVILILCMLKSYKKTVKKYRSAYGDVIKLINIAISLIQVNSSLVNVSPHITWPSNLISFYHIFNVFNFEFTSMIGGKCVSPLLGTFTIKYIVLCSLPTIIILITFILYSSQRCINNNGSKEGGVDNEEANVAIAEDIFDAYDDDRSDTIDSNELVSLLNELNVKIEIDECKKMILSLKDTATTTANDDNDRTIAMKRSVFIRFLLSGQLPGLNITNINQLRINTENKKYISHMLSSSLQLLAILHTPVSRSTFSYFQCHNIYGKSFMRTDYSIECYSLSNGEWYAFLPVVLLILVLYCILMPVSIGLYIFINRKKLYTVKIQQKIGFLYQGFTKNAEWWLVHEMMRKLLLTGFLVMIPTVLKTPFGIIISLIALINLNYFKPYRNIYLFWVSQASFCITALTFCMSSVFDFNQFNGNNSMEKEEERVAIILISLNVFFFALTVISAIMVIIVLKQKIDIIRKKESTKVIPFHESERDEVEK